MLPIHTADKIKAFLLLSALLSLSLFYPAEIALADYVPPGGDPPPGRSSTSSTFL
jgi:hypothetical protein